MKTSNIALVAGLVTCMGLSATAWSGAKIAVDDNISVTVGARVQALAIRTDKDLDGDGDYEKDNDFRVRRARLLIKTQLQDNLTFFIQTEAAEDGERTGSDMRVIDSWVNYQFDNWLQLYAGQHMAPASRQSLTASNKMMAIDRPGNNTKNLTWGARSLSTFSTSTFGPSNDSAITGRNAVRDVGMSLFGAGELSDGVHLKYYAGMFDGVQKSSAAEDNLRYTARVQLNLMDDESGFWNSSTYLGKKKTVGLGLSYDMQDKVQDATLTNEDTGLLVGDGDYTYWSVDAFADLPLGPGALTLEAAYSELDLGSATQQSVQSQGNGWYLQTGFYINKWQPWVEFEAWDSDSNTGVGSYDMARIGVNYYIQGHNANFKLGLEKLNSDQNITDEEDSITSLVFGIYTNF